MVWAAEEFRGLDLGDTRREVHTGLLTECLANRPMASPAGACAGWAETQGAYRLFRQELFDWIDLLAPHRAYTTRRMAHQPMALCLRDTTALDFNDQQLKGLGPLSDEAQRGLYLYPTLTASPEREPLGVLDAWMWARELKGEDGLCPANREVTDFDAAAELADW